MSGPVLHGTGIPGLLHAELELHGDARGWFKESYQRVKLEAQGLPRLDIVQNNVSYNATVGVTRGIHAEPWDKWISPAHGLVFNAVVDLREGDTFGAVETFELGPGQALHVPRGCGNAFCTLEPHTVYNYLVTGHWSAAESYLAVNLFDPALGIGWPLPRDQLVLSDRDASHPPLSQVRPFPAPR